MEAGRETFERVADGIHRQRRTTPRYSRQPISAQAFARERAKTGDSVYCRAEDADNLLEVDRLAGRGLIRFYMEAGNGSMQVDVPGETARSIAQWILDHTQGGRAA